MLIFSGLSRRSKPRCVASHDLRSFAQPDACAPQNGFGPHQPGTSFDDFDTFSYSGALSRALDSGVEVCFYYGKQDTAYAHAHSHSSL